MKKIFEKHETLCCILLIILYVVVNSYCIQNFGYTSYISFIINTIFSIGLIGIIVALKKHLIMDLQKLKMLKNIYISFH